MGGVNLKPFSSDSARAARARRKQKESERKARQERTTRDALAKLQAYILDRTRDGREIVLLLVDLMKATDATPSERLKACELLLRYGVGPPPQQVQVSGQVTLESLVLAAHAAQATICQDQEAASLPDPGVDRVVDAEAVVRCPDAGAVDPPVPESAEAPTPQPVGPPSEALPGGATLGDLVT
jgi:hypothetical protein